MSITYKEGTRLKVWKIDRENGRLNASTSEKRDEKYFNSSWWFKLGGNAKENIGSIQEGDVIYIKFGKESTFKNPDGKYIETKWLFDFATTYEDAIGKVNPPIEKKQNDPRDSFEEELSEVEIDDSGLPF